MDVINHLQFQEKETIDVKVENDVYVIRVSYSLTAHQLSIDVEEKKTFEFYHTVLNDSSIPEELCLYENVQTIYSYLSQSPQKIMSYNTLGKYILFFDYISNRLKYNKIHLQKRVLSLEERKDIKITKLIQQKQDLIEQVERLRNQLQKIKETQSKLSVDYRQSQNQRQMLLFRILKQEDQIELLKRENQELKKKYGISHRSQEQEENMLNNLRKLRKGQNEELIVRKLFNDSQIGKQQKSQEQKCNSVIIPCIHDQKSGIFESTSPDIVYYGTKMKTFIDDQPNKKEFKLIKNTIEKISASETSCLLFLSSEEKIYFQEKKQNRVFIQIKNISLPSIINSSDFNLIVGIIAHSAASVLNSSYTKSAIYLNTGKSSIYLSGTDIKTNFNISIKRYDIVRLVIDYEVHLIAWFLNDSLLGQVVIDSALIRQGFCPFIELKAKNSSIEIL